MSTRPRLPQASSRTALTAGMLGAVGLVTAIYLLMAAGLVLSVPHSALQGSPGNFAALAGFATAFEYKGLGWAKYVVAAGEAL